MESLEVIGEKAKEASYVLGKLTVNEKNKALRAVAKAWGNNEKFILEANAADVTNETLKAGTTKRWSNLSNLSSDLGYTHQTTDPSFTSEYYVYRALVIPQEVAYENLPLSGPLNTSTAKPYLMVKYTMDYGNNTTESFTSYYNLAAAFGKNATDDKLPFNEGWMNTLDITLGPETIEFSGQVNQFAAQSSVNIPPTNGN